MPSCEIQPPNQTSFQIFQLRGKQKRKKKKKTTKPAQQLRPEVPLLCNRKFAQVKGRGFCNSLFGWSRMESDGSGARQRGRGGQPRHSDPSHTITQKRLLKAIDFTERSETAGFWRTRQKELQKRRGASAPGHTAEIFPALTWRITGRLPCFSCV